MSESVRAPLVLTLICTAVCALLSLSHEMTKDQIAAAEEMQLQTTLTAAFGDAAYTPLETALPGVNQIIRDAQGRLIFDVTASGYEKDSQRLLIGLDPTGAVCGVSFVSVTDSPTQAAKVQEDAFLAQFSGISDPAAETDGISGATRSANGVRSAVAFVLQTYLENREALSDG